MSDPVKEAFDKYFDIAVSKTGPEFSQYRDVLFSLYSAGYDKGRASALESVNAAFDAEIQGVSAVPYPSNEICRWFHDCMMKRIAK